MSPFLPRFPSDRIRLLYVETELQLRSLMQALAARKPDRAPVPPALLAEARRLLNAVARLMSREKHWGAQFVLHAAPGWTELSARLALADTALRRFAAIYLPAPDSLDDDEDLDSASPR
ncbi:MAG: hypothetical protein EOP22_15275 [Hyphomicrobiales bacterium]|nr:MAG: hypothetical protein EOP22_15275 [Hyphomicrobiales bacterium]